MKLFERVYFNAVMALASACLGLMTGCSYQDEETHFHFDWPVPSHAIVEMEVEEAGEKIRIRYSLDLERGKTPDELHLFYRDFEILQMGDTDLDDPAVRAELAPLLAITQTVRPLVIDKEGRFLRFDDWNSVADATAEFLTDMNPNIDEAVIDHVVMLMRDPSTKKQVQATAAHDWNLWVNTWNGLRLRLGESLDLVYTMNLPWGGRVDAAGRITYVSRDGSKPANHRIQLHSTCSSPEFREALISSMQRMLPGSDPDSKRVAEMRASIKECSMTSDATAITDPTTLMPVSITSTKITRVAGPDGSTKEKTEKRHYRFQWK